MGTSLPISPSPPISLTPTPHDSQLSPRSHQKFTIRQILTQSPQQHQDLITTITKFKQYHHDNIVRLVDSHSVESHNLCSVLSHLYVIIEKPEFALQKFRGKLKNEGRDMDGRQVEALLVGCSRGLEYLKGKGQEISHLKESHIYVDMVENSQIVAKIMNPYYLEEEYEEICEKSVEEQLAKIVKKYANKHLSLQLTDILDKMENNLITLRDVIQIYDNKVMPKCRNKSKSGIKLVKGGQRTKSKTQHHTQRQSIATVVSNTSSLLIDAGGQGDKMFKDFYEHFDSDISQIQQNKQNENSIFQGQLRHQFPKKYLKSKAFKKMNITMNSSEWLSSKSLWSEHKVEHQNITRDQSMKENIRVESKYSLLDSAKLAQSYVDFRR